MTKEKDSLVLNKDLGFWFLVVIIPSILIIIANVLTLDYNDNQNLAFRIIMTIIFVCAILFFIKQNLRTTKLKEGRV